jgi:putative photosynthetic complex assembly protein 2
MPMINYFLPVCYTLFIWWLTTGVLLYLHRLPSRTYPLSMLVMLVAAGGAIYGHALASMGTEPVHAYLAFSCAVVIWGWLELGYFTGFLVGPNCDPCPEDCVGWRRFDLAVRTGLYLEIAVIATAVVLVIAAWDAPNQVGVWSFLVLWFMRWSAKLNLFLGVPNLHDHWLPEHMRFLLTYMVRRPMNLLFPLSITAATVILGLLVQIASQPQMWDFLRVGLMLVSTLLALGILEHWFLVLPFSEEVMWRWAMKGKQPASLAQGQRVSSHTEGGPNDLSFQEPKSECSPCLIQAIITEPAPKGCSIP